MEFRRARTDEQRSERRRTILATAAAMLTEMPVAQLSLNELSKRVGLARSNVLRYFESREDILLELLDHELSEAITGLDLSIRAEDPLEKRVEAVGTAISTALAQRAVLCDLISAQSAVLERNVSTHVALRHKRATQESVTALLGVMLTHVPELTQDEAIEVIATTILLVAGAWPQNQPTQALLAAYEADPSIAQFKVEFADIVRRSVESNTYGLLARRVGLAHTAAPDADRSRPASH